MQLLPEEWDAFTVGVSVIATIAAVVGVATGLQSASASAHARNTIAWSSSVLGIEDDPARLRTVRAQQQAAVAHLVAADLVPLRKFAESVFWLLLMATATAAIQVLRPTQNVVIFGTAAIIVTAWNAARRFIRVYCERVRVATEYIAGVDPITPPRLSSLDKMEGGTRLEFDYGLAAAISFTALAGSIAALLTQGAPQLLALSFIACALIALYVTGRLVRRYARRLAFGELPRARARKTRSPKKSR